MLDVACEVKSMKRIVSGACTAAALLLMMGCSSSTKQARGPESAPGSFVGGSFVGATATHGAAERIVVGAGACWLGGLWSDALGETTQGSPSSRRAAIARSTVDRCHALLTTVYGRSDETEYRQLRALDPRLVDAIGVRVNAVAQSDATDRPRADALVALLGAVAEAGRENFHARKAADAVKNAEEGTSSAAERTDDKTDAGRALQQTDALDRLLRLNVGSLTPDARAFGLLFALDRLEIARRLPKHLKVDAVGAPFACIFGVQPPAVSPDATQPIPTGTWPDYLEFVAWADGHPVPVAAVEPIDRESLAWVGVLSGFSDRLRAVAPQVSPATFLPLAMVRVAARLEEEDRNVVAVFEAQHPQQPTGVAEPQGR
jgi:hypothetical protein